MTVISEDDERLKFVPLDVLETPPVGLIEHIKDSYWVTHPDKGAVFWRSTMRGDNYSCQCNRVESMVKSLRDRMYPWAGVVFVPSAFRRIDPQDYCY